MPPESLRFTCSKCRGNDCEIGEIHAVGGFWGKIFDVQNRKLTTVTCTRCRYTELYATDDSTGGSTLADIFDFLTG